MSKREKKIEIVKKNIKIIRCPICHNPMQMLGVKSIICPENHTFDFAKQGYLNMLTRPVNSQYDKQLFTARQKIIMESGLYTILHEKIVENMGTYIQKIDSTKTIFDAGCGEGSHLHEILRIYNEDSVIPVGIDIAKESILMAAQNYQETIWLVGDLANAPLANQSQHIILNILSPANYMEFKRLLTTNGLMIKVIPRSTYLQELRENLFIQDTHSTFDNTQVINLFKQHFTMEKSLQVTYEQELKQTDLLNLVQMTPLAWKAEKEQINRFVEQQSTKVTIDFDLLIGKKLPEGVE